MSAEINDKQKEWFATGGVATLTELGFAPGQRVLDFGCGPGRLAVPLSRIVADKGGRVIALGRSADALEALQQRLETHGRKAAVEAVLIQNSDGLAEMGRYSVDAVVAFDVLQHVHNWNHFFDAAAGALAPAGQLYVYPAAKPHRGLVDMAAIRKALVERGFRQTAARRLRLPHAHTMVDDVVYVFARNGQ